MFASKKIFSQRLLHSKHAGQGSAPRIGARVPANTPALIRQDTPGAYAYEKVSQGQRLAKNQQQAASVAGHTITACGSVRALAPASTFSLSGHASAQGAAAPAPQATLRVIHQARNNLSAQINGHAQTLVKLASSPLDMCASSYGINSIVRSAETPDIFYRNAALVLPLTVTYRGAGTDAHGQLIHPKPSVSGSQTALVIGVAGQHLTTDRDHRVKVQFAWQRGASSQSRLAHPAQDGHSGAPAEDGSTQTTGTWVRVATPLAPIAGANWGSVALPRIGQEVLITFLGGDIDRPVVTGSLYNGRGQDNQQSNQVAAGAANATGNAPSWFPGDQQASGKQGKLPGHAHNAVLSGIKTQALSASQTGAGGYNQFVFDDTPGQSRLGLQSHNQQQGGAASGGNHSGSHELNLGALRQQTDNQRLGSTGYGFELKTHFSGAIRSGSGMLLTADKRQGNESGASSHQMDSKEAQSQLQTGQDLVKALSLTAQQHKAMLPVLKTTEVKPDKLPVMMSFAEMGKSLQALDVRGAAAYLQHNADPNEALEKFDEQIQFLNVHGAKLAKVNYSLEMADGSIVKGLTDAEGKTKRVVTDKPQSITQATLHTSQVASCCAEHAEQSAGKSEGFVVEVKDVETNSQDVGTSVKRVTTARGKSRPMTAGEIDMATNLFGQSVDYSKVKVYNGEFIWFGLQDDDTAMTPNGKMYYPKNLYREDFSNSEEPDMQLLFMHEMVHIWQHQCGYSVIWHGWQRWRLSYKYEFGTDLLLCDFDMEAQGNILSDYWSLKNFGETATLSKSDYRYLTRLDLFEETLAEFLKDPASKTNLPEKSSNRK